MSGHDHNRGAAGTGNRGKLVIVFGSILAARLALQADAGKCSPTPPDC